ncbi:MAG TPA: type IV toxin-antitoxin system AbiEi family antitoxin domain-containing protein [Verrucomicrobiae bacterium]|nr:type IV toxin-antitoxin system AbiEi family antitoxin domain-containing protein [Verrucomicrobiae bacterium]
MARASTLERLIDYAEDQWGLVTRRQALSAGVPASTLRRLVTDGRAIKPVAHGVYRVGGAPPPDHESLRAAWLQLAPDVPAWERGAANGVVSHRSAAEMYGIGHFAEERHEFTLARRRQSKRPDVRLHRRRLTDAEWIVLRGLPVTRPARIASDLLYDGEDAAGVAHLIGDALRGVYDYPGTVAEALAPHASSFGLRRNDGVALLDWMLDLVGEPEITFWIDEARAHQTRVAAVEIAPSRFGAEIR